MKKQTLCALLLFSVLAVCAYPEGGRIGLSQADFTSAPIIITVPGNYVLTENVSVSTFFTGGIWVQADDVTIDLNGFTLEGPSDSSGADYGIRQDSQFRGLTVKNGFIKGWQGAGIYAGGEGNRFDEVTLCANAAGLNSGPGAQIARCVAVENETSADGYGILATAGANVSSCISMRNWAGGSMSGIWVGDGSVVSDCVVARIYGVSSCQGIYAGQGSVVSRCSVGEAGSSTNAVGISAGMGSTVSESAVITCSSSGAVYGIYSAGAGMISHCAADYQDSTVTNGAGIRAGESTYVLESVACGNDVQGMWLGNGCRSSKCLTRFNEPVGVQMGGQDARMQDCLNAVNLDVNVQVWSLGNLIARNHAISVQFGTNYEVIAGNRFEPEETSGVFTNAWANFSR